MLFRSVSQSRYDDRCGIINDLRSTIKQIFGEEQLPYITTYRDLYSIMSSNMYGEWYRLEDFMRIKLFKKGTIHIELTEDIADRLNLILAENYKDQLPPTKQAFYREQDKRHKSKPKATFKDHILLNNVIREYISNKINRIESLNRIDTTDKMFIDLCNIMGGERDGNIFTFNK